jgi:hypothetical protein
LLFLAQGGTGNTLHGQNRCLSGILVQSCAGDFELRFEITIPQRRLDADNRVTTKSGTTSSTARARRSMRIRT